jgi:thioredoxin-like negative regulator of GroEL
LLNGETIWQVWGVKSVPSVLLVKDGQILQHWSGEIDLKELEQAVQARLRPLGL